MERRLSRIYLTDQSREEKHIYMSAFKQTRTQQEDIYDCGGNWKKNI